MSEVKNRWIWWSLSPPKSLKMVLDILLYGTLVLQWYIKPFFVNHLKRSCWYYLDDLGTYQRQQTRYQFNSKTVIVLVFNIFKIWKLVGMNFPEKAWIVKYISKIVPRRCHWYQALLLSFGTWQILQPTDDTLSLVFKSLGWFVFGQFESNSFGKIMEFSKMYFILTMW